MLSEDAVWTNIFWEIKTIISCGTASKDWTMGAQAREFIDLHFFLASLQSSPGFQIGTIDII